MNAFEFASPSSLHWLWAVAAALGLAWWAHAARKRAVRRFADSPLFAQLAPRARPKALLAVALASAAAMASLAVALGDPRSGDREAEVQRKGIDVMFVVDVSRSMLADDVAPNRLGRAKQFINDALDSLAGDRAGLIAFAGTPTLKSPLTLNYGAFRLAVNELAPQSSVRGGSLLGDAIRMAADAFTDDTQGGKAIVVLTDGEDMESFPVEAAKKAFSDKGIRTYTIGIGDSHEGSRIPIAAGRDGTATTYLTFDGQEVWSKMNPTLLTEVALAGGGAFIPAGVAQVDMADVYDATVAAVGRKTFDTQATRRPIAQFQWPAALALLFLAFGAFVEWRTSRRAGPSRTGVQS
jgi:Ca-activated chloride channel family protein